MQKVTIDNFSGKLARDTHGDLNSGFCPLVSGAFGGVYPFANISYPSQLAFIETATSIGATIVTDPVLHFWNGTNPASGTIAASFGVGLTGVFYMVSPHSTAADDAVTKFSNVIDTATLYYGGGLHIGNLRSTAIAGASVAYVGTDNGVYYSSSLAPATAYWTQVGSGWTANVPRPEVEFLGKLYVANGNNIAEVISGNTVSTYAKLSPSLPVDYTIRDMEISNDGRYLVMVATFLNNPSVSLKVDGTNNSLGNQPLFSAVDSAVVLWNGTDTGYTSFQSFKGISLSSIIVSNTETLVFGKDAEGVGLYDLNGNKIVPIPETSNLTVSYPPLPGQLYALGKKIFFEMEYASTFYVFCLDREDNSLYCLYSTDPNPEFVKGAITVPSVHGMNTTTDLSQSKIYFSFGSIPISTQANNFLYKQNLQVYGSATRFGGVYSTQVQKVFYDEKGQIAEKVQPVKMRVYTLPMASGMIFTASLTDGNLNAISGTTNTYTYAAGTDRTKAQGAMTMVSFPLNCNPVSEFGLQISNAGSGSPVVEKIEVDYEPVHNPSPV